MDVPPIHTADVRRENGCLLLAELPVEFHIGHVRHGFLSAEVGHTLAGQRSGRFLGGQIENPEVALAFSGRTLGYAEILSADHEAGDLRVSFLPSFGIELNVSSSLFSCLAST